MYSLTSEPATLAAVGIGALVGVLALFMREHKRWSLIMALFVSGAAMLLTAQSVPRFVRVLSGQHMPTPGSVLALTSLSIISLIHLTLGIRWVLGNRRSAKS
jgi:uncharacterized membrane protein (UPF0136 family)